MMQTELELLRDISQRLEAAGITFMLTGSVAMNYYAQPRMTRDIDLVAELSDVSPEAFVRLFEPDYYVNDEAVSRAIARRAMFNLIHNASIIKVDFIVLKSDPYRQEEFARRRQVNLGDFKTWIVSREDLILSKLYWAKDSRSEMQLRDVNSLLAAEYDAEYLQKWAPALGVNDLLREALARDE